MTAPEKKANSAPEYWDEKADFFASDERRRRIRRLADLYETSCWRYIEPVLPSKETGIVLEAGCGTGRWVYHLAPLGYRLDLLDFSGEMIRHAEAKVTRQGLDESVRGYHVQDLCDMSALPDNGYDLVLSLGMPLSLCDDPEQAAAEIFRITKPGGWVICDAMNRYRTALDMARKNNMTQLFNALNQGKVVAESGLTHHCFSPDELELLFLGQGFASCQLAAITPFFDVPPLKDQVALLDDDTLFNQVANLFQAVSEDPGVIGVSSRLLIVTQKPEAL
ncbi:class I SAM-dependent methyltransferase [Desulfoluna spongiiphila]|uniref:Ubiquinone/menaquinone biosynthesis C-methylase UbiE n=1 Tax=Desulfoluna spongiiphila TaxID=419481 RepID=A0A1G5HJN7_9BACT|nr:class I SAM-dependent methyltransferase [Desulfoluna spongiiphila]SCY63993.1 Ubiquinone/menaquinone biosynthesis C-methylase UbiE [Desulfoluna spongiiphila]